MIEEDLIEATVLRLQPGDIVVVQITDETQGDQAGQAEAREEKRAAFARALQHIGRGDDVSVILTADRLEMQVVRTSEW